ncbi:MAG: metal-dependent transcriptional regulator [Geovibrio sp.]|nr:metal-dependent transcriptional regulator [Geovibrio sp.]
MAKKLGVSLPSVSRAVSTLAKMGLLTHESYGKIGMTEEGKTIGKSIVRRDKCLTKLLVDILGMEPEDADPEVHRLEHLISGRVLPRLEILVHYAVSDPSWLEGLHRKIDAGFENREEVYQFGIGETPIHKGAVTEKRNK